MHDRLSFLHFGNDRSAAHLVACFDGHVDVPKFFGIQGIYLDTAVDIGAAGFCDLTQRPLDTVKNIIQDTRRQSNGNRISGCLHGLTRTKPCSLLEYLDCGGILGQIDYLSYQALFPDIYHLSHLESGIALQINDGTVDAVDHTCLIHGSYLRQNENPV